MSEEMSAMELLEARETEAYEELGKLAFDDPARGKILNEIRTYSDIRIANEQTEQNRLNNNSKNDIEEQRVAIEAQKVQNDRVRMNTELAKAGLFLLGGLSSTFLSYSMEEWFQKFTPLQRFGEKLHDFIVRK